MTCKTCHCWRLLSAGGMGLGGVGRSTSYHQVSRKLTPSTRQAPMHTNRCFTTSSFYNCRWSCFCIYIIGVSWNSRCLMLSFSVILAPFCSSMMIVLLYLKDRTIVEVKWYVPLASIRILHPGGSGTRFGWRKGLIGVK
jgi:hypothetical protein